MHLITELIELFDQMDESKSYLYLALIIDTNGQEYFDTWYLDCSLITQKWIDSGQSPHLKLEEKRKGWEENRIKSIIISQ